MPPAFALSQDQTLRFIQASPQHPKRPHSNTQTNSQGSALSPITSQLTPNNQAPSHNTQNTHPQKEHTPRRRPRIPPRHSSQQGKNTQKQSPAPSHPKTAKHYQLPKKPDAIVKQQKKNQQTERLNGIPNAGPSNPPNIGRARKLASNH